MDQRPVEDVYQQAGLLSPMDRLRLIERIARSLAEERGAAGSSPTYDWMAVRGIAPTLQDGEDAQEWVSRTREESDAERDDQLGRRL